MQLCVLAFGNSDSSVTNFIQGCSVAMSLHFSTFVKGRTAREGRGAREQERERRHDPAPVSLSYLFDTSLKNLLC